jgi:CBS domain-containing protein
MDEDELASVSEAYRFLLGLRLRLQLRMVAEGKPPANSVALADLPATERSRLKDAFRAIRRWQEAAAYGFHAEV